ncbi:MAG: POTRA domain-containing protein, partial [Cyanobacteria bacterium J06621_15]
MFNSKICFHLISIVILNCLTINQSIAQTNPLPSPQDIQPPTPQPLPTPSPPQRLPPPSELLEPSTPNPIPSQPLPDITDTIVIKKFEFIGNTAFNQEELAEVLKDFTNKPITFAQLEQAKSAVVQYYIDNKYVTSGAFIPVGQSIEDGVVQIEIVEGKLEEIQISGNTRLKSDYIRSRIARATKTPLNQEKLLEALQLLQINPLIESLSAELSAGTRPGLNVLLVRVEDSST